MTSDRTTDPSPADMNLLDLFSDIAQLISTIKIEWELQSAWTAWDQSVLDRVLEQLRLAFPAPSTNLITLLQARLEQAERERDGWRRVAERLAAGTEATTLRKRVEMLEGALTAAREAIASLPEDALGTNSDGVGDTPGLMRSWPIRDEMLHNIDRALANKETENV